MAGLVALALNPNTPVAESYVFLQVQGRAGLQCYVEKLFQKAKINKKVNIIEVRQWNG